jgi:hypothetical protein
VGAIFVFWWLVGVYFLALILAFFALFFGFFFLIFRGCFGGGFHPFNIP